MTSKTWGWVLVVVGVGGAGSAVWLFARLGLDQGDQLASVLSFFIGAAGLAASTTGLFLMRKQHTGHTITRSVIGGNVETVRNVKGNLVLRPAPTAATSPTLPSPAPADTNTGDDAGGDGHSITDSAIGGTTRTVDGVGGNAEIG